MASKPTVKPNESQKVIVDDGALRYTLELRGFRVPAEILDEVRTKFEQDLAGAAEFLQSEGYIRFGALPQ